MSPVRGIVHGLSSALYSFSCLRTRPFGKPLGRIGALYPFLGISCLLTFCFFAYTFLSQKYDFFRGDKYNRINLANENVVAGTNTVDNHNEEQIEFTTPDVSSWVDKLISSFSIQDHSLLRLNKVKAKGWHARIELDKHPKLHHCRISGVEMVSRFPPKEPRLAVVIPFLSREYDDLLALINSWSEPGKRPCSQSNQKTRSPIDLVFQVDPSVQTAELESKEILQSCFRKVWKIPMNESLPYGLGPPTAFHELVHHSLFRASYDFFFLMEPDVVPVRDDWLGKLVEECQDQQPFWVKGSIALNLDAGEMRLADQQNVRWPKFFHINGNALYNVWDENFLKFIDFSLLEEENVFGEEAVRRRQSNFDSAIANSLFRYHCRWKVFGAMFSYSRFILNNPRPAPSTYDRETYLVHKLVPESSCQSKLRNCDFWFSQNPLSKLPLSFSHLPKRNRPGEPRLAIAATFVRHQTEKLKSKFLLWNSEKFFPCTTKRNSVLVLQGPPEVLSETLKFARGVRSVQECFEEVISFPIALPADSNGYKYGPPTAFLQLMMSEFFDSHVDYMLLMEPDVSPIKENWLDLLHREIRETDDFWVKGSLGMYADHDDAQGGYTFVSEDFSDRDFDPVGPRLVHINGNALYNTWDPLFKFVLVDAALSTKTYYKPLYEREDRWDCKITDDSHLRFLCAGSFDTSIADYIFFSRSTIKMFLHKYRFSHFILNDPDYGDLGWTEQDSLPFTGLLSHKLRCGSRIPKSVCPVV